MQELLKTAWLGWLNYTDNGKFAALLLAVLLFMWLGGSFRKQRELYIYTVVFTVCCIVPVTAAVLMTYQTKFYDYEWIWSLVPMTMMIAYGLTEFAACTVKYAQKEYAGRTGHRILFLSGMGALALAIVLLCGGLGSNTWKAQPETTVLVQADGEECEAILSLLTKQENAVCLWAPQGMMEYARSFDGSILLPYGRNMWDAHLNAYSYDVYDEETKLLYQWMCGVERTGAFDVTVKDGGREFVLAGKDCMAIAEKKGVNNLLLPETIPDETLKAAEKLFGSSSVQLGRFYLLMKEQWPAGRFT